MNRPLTRDEGPNNDPNAEGGSDPFSICGLLEPIAEVWRPGSELVTNTVWDDSDLVSNASLKEFD